MNASNTIATASRRDISSGHQTVGGFVAALNPRMPLWLVAAAIALMVCLAPAARAATIVHEFFLPMPESQISQTFNALETGVSNTLDSTFSVVITGAGTVVYYDQWEDGYETDLAHPAQASTKVWGDGNNANGIAPGFTNDPIGLPAGTVLTLRNLVPLPRNPSNLLYDGRDRIAATKALVVARMAWPVSPGSVLADATAVPATIDYGTSYVSPVGQDVTNAVFGYVAMMVMAGEDNTTVTIDSDGPGVAAPFNITLNRGESYLVNGGIKKGASVNSTKPVQVNLVTGRVRAQYETDWFALTPVPEWSSSYFTPVGQTKSGYPTYVFLYNPQSTNITINVTTRAGSSTVTVPGNSGVTQFAMPMNSGAKFSSSNGQKFFALTVVSAGPSSQVYDWGFTLLPFDGLTTEAVVGLGLGSTDGSQNGSPVWVTAPSATRVYVDYNGDRAGPLTDPNGNKYDVAYDIAALESKTVYDPDKNQTAMRLYTLDGTVISAAWGEDASVAGSGNPYLDAGTTVLPFPVPVLKKTFVITNDVAPPGMSIGDTLEYTVTLDNKGLLPLGNTVVIDALPTNILRYVTNTTRFDGTPIPDDTVGTPFPLDEAGYTIPIILRAGTSSFSFRCTTLTAGSITNVVSAVGYSLTASAVAAPPPTGGSTACNLKFTDSLGTNVTTYSAGSPIYVKLTDNDANTSSNTVQSMTAAVRNLNNGDLEVVTLFETGTNTGVFRNTNALPSSTTAGLPQQDGTLYVSPGDVLSVQYTDPVYADACSDNAVISAPTRAKVLYLSPNGVSALNQDMDRIDPVATGDNTTAQSVVLGSAGSGTVSAVSTTSGGNANASSLTISHTVSAGANRLMMVSVAVGASGTTASDAGTVSSVTFGGTALTLVGVTNDPGTRVRSAMYRLLNPSVGTSNVVITLSASRPVYGGVTTFTGVDQTTPFGTVFRGAGGSSSGPTGVTTGGITNVTSAVGELVYDAIAVDGDNNTAEYALVAAAGQTRLWAGTNLSGSVYGASSTKPGAPSITNGWSWLPSGEEQFGIVAVSIKPAAGGGGGGTNVTTFTQAPSFASAFTLPAGGTILITNFVTITNGSLSATPAITARLKFGATNIITLTNAAYTASNSNLVWTGTLTNSITVPVGQAIDLVISNAEVGVSYRIDFDSAAKPSKVVLPTTSIINVDSIGVYDAPYPGGSLVTTPVSGSQIYVRTVVSDPFGAYDIRSLNLAIDGAGTSDDISATLTNAVATNSLTKTYEYVWQTGATLGSYNISATANEGTEGITNSAGTSVTLIVLDLGTPSTTTFTSGDNGPATNSFATNQPVCVRVNDQDQNTSATTVQLLNVTVTSSTGDSENLVLTETSTNSGVFTGCLSTSVSGGTGTNNNILNAPAGTVLTVSYTDPDDSGDQSSATANILTPPGVPGVNVTKSLVSPADGQAGVGEPVVYNIQVINTGSTVLTNVSVTDTFPATNLAYVSASLTPNIIAASSLVWTNVGPLTPGQSVSFTVNFTAIATTNAARNSVTVSGGPGASSSNSVPVAITSSALTITKSLLNPTNGPVNVGSNVTFRIVVRNSGTTFIPDLPLEDTFGAAQFQYVSATLTPDGTGSGSLLWNDITGTNSLAPTNSITIDVTMKVIGAGNPSQNTAHAEYAVDSYGNPVPSASDTVGLVTGAATVMGTVYNDLDKSGTLTGGDTGLSGVSIEIYSDPNGDGNPADGSLIRLVTTGAAGDYELPNLSTGRFVVVETDLPGYASSFPVNNRLALNITSLTTNAGINFFDYVPVVTNYATIGGSVWNDANTNGVKDISETGINNVSIELVQDFNTNGLADPGEPVTASVTTGTNGAYSFSGVIPGSYVIRETDIFGYISTGDSRPPNDNQIGITVGSGAVTNGNNFLDYFLGSAPVAVDDAASTPEDTAVILNVLANDFDVDGDPITITNAFTTNGLVVIVGGTNLLFTPATNFNGAATVSYTITDNKAGSSNAVVVVTVTSVNDVPVAVNDSYSVSEDTLLSVPVSGVLTNDSDADGDTLGALLVATTTNGVLTLNANGSFTYQPVTNFFGVDHFTYRAGDGITNSALATVTITVNAVNDAPIANNQSVTIPEDTSTNLVLTASDVDSTNLVYSLLSGPTHGTTGVLNTNTGAVTYSPSNNYAGPDSFTFTVFDGSLYATGTVSITVTPINDAPVANNQSVTIPEDTSTNLVLTASDVDSSNLVYSVLSAPTHGFTSAFNTNTGAITYTPSTNYSGPDSFTFRVFDGSLYATGTVSITVTPVNDAPLAFSQSLTNLEDTALPITLTSADVDGPVTNFVLVGLPTHGVLSGSGANLTYTPSNNYNGADVFTFTVNDGSLTSAVATVSITVLPVNDVPVAVNDNYSVFKNTTLTVPVSGVLTNDSDVDGDTLTAVLATNVIHGTLVLNGNGSFTYTPATNYAGTDTFAYRASDGVTNSLALVTITVLATNTAPVANNDNYSVSEDTVLSVPVSGVLTNDTDVDADALTATLVATTTNGILSLNANGSFTYTPGTNFAGVDHFTYRANDAQTNSGIATVTITVNAVNDAPVATNLAVTIPEDTSTNLVVTGNDVDNTNLTYAVLGVPTHGSLGVMNTNTGAITYTPSTNYNGPDSFTFTVFDGSLYATGTVSIVVTPVNDPPLAVNDFATTAEDVPVNIPALLNDTDPDGDGLTIVGVTTTNGSYSFNATNINYRPSTNFFGTNVMTYSITDGVFTNSALITVVVTPVNDAPVANNQSVTIPEDTSTNLVLTASDVDSSNLVYSVLSAPTHGVTSALNTNTGAITYTPSTNYSGPDSFTFTVYDGSLYATGTVSITVTPVNDAPLAFSQSLTNLEDTALPITLTSADVDGPVTNFVLVGLPTHGVLSGSGANLTYTPSTNYNGADAFTFTVNDGSLTSAVATVSITVLPVNDAPIANNQSVTIPEDTSTNLVLTASDIDSSNLVYSVLSAPAHGFTSAFNTNTGAITYTPSTNYVGADSFTFRVFDGSLYATGTVSITVTPVNDPPVVVNDVSTTPEDTSVNVPVLANDSDPDNDPLTLVGVVSTNGTAVVSGTNVVYTPSTNFVGTNVMTYTVTDGTVTNSGLITVIVTAVNDAPVANNQSVTIPEDTSTNLLLTASDVDSSNLVFAVLSNPAHGSLGTLNTNTGAVTYSPNSNYFGPDSFTFTVFDGSLYATGTVSITVTPVNDAPIAVDDAYSVFQNGVLTVSAGGVLTNDTDVESDSLVAFLVSNPGHGTLNLSTNGGFTYIPTNGYTGSDSFTYRANDGVSNSGIATVTITVVPVADLAVTKTGPATVVPGVNFNYVISVTNMGPSAASNVVTYDSLPTNLTFVAASSGGVISNNVVRWPVITNFARGFVTNYTITVTTLTNGSFVNMAYTTSATGDPSMSNNDGSGVSSRVSTLAAPATFGVRQGTNVLNPQTGLYEQSVSITNLSGSTIAALQLLVGDIRGTNGVLRTNVWLWNASGTNVDSRPYLQYNSPLDPGAVVTLRLEFYNPTRTPFTNSLEVIATLPTPATTNLSGGVAIDVAFMDNRIPGEPRFVIEWASVPGRSYTVIYGPSVLGPWTAATPSVTASANRTQWYDDGPPKTASKPTNGSRFYRVISNP